MNTINELNEKYDLGSDSNLAIDPLPQNIDHVPAKDVVSVYFRQMAAEPLLTPEQEVALSKRIQRGAEALTLLENSPDLSPEERDQLEPYVASGRKARQQLARANTRLVVSIAKRYRNRGLPFSDLIQEGNTGLMTAVDKFDYALGNRFSTYATWWIRQSITRAIAQKSRAIRIPLHLSARLRRIHRLHAKLTQELGRAPTEQEIAKQIGLPPKEVTDLLSHTLDLVSLEAPVGKGTPLAEFLRDEDAFSSDEWEYDHALRKTIREMLEELPHREAQILCLRFGLKDGVSQTLEQVGKQLGLSRERVRQLESSALRTLRRPPFVTILHKLIQTG